MLKAICAGVGLGLGPRLSHDPSEHTNVCTGRLVSTQLSGANIMWPRTEKSLGMSKSLKPRPRPKSKEIWVWDWLPWSNFSSLQMGYATSLRLSFTKQVGINWQLLLRLKLSDMSHDAWGVLIIPDGLYYWVQVSFPFSRQGETEGREEDKGAGKGKGTRKGERRAKVGSQWYVLLKVDQHQ